MSSHNSGSEHAAKSLPQNRVSGLKLLLVYVAADQDVRTFRISTRARTIAVAACLKDCCCHDLLFGSIEFKSCT